jgi:hypothetical protein
VSGRVRDADQNQALASACSLRRRTAPRCRRLPVVARVGLLLLALVGFTAVVWAAGEDAPLAPPDTASPAATLATLLDGVEAAYAARETGKTDRAQLAVLRKDVLPWLLRAISSARSRLGAGGGGAVDVAGQIVGRQPDGARWAASAAAPRCAVDGTSVVVARPIGVGSRTDELVYRCGVDHGPAGAGVPRRAASSPA